MAGFDELIRKAITNHAEEGAGPASAAQRAAIYDSSRTALERMLAQNPTLDEAAAVSQRERLNAAIARIEADFAPAGSQQAQPASDHQPDAQPHPLPPSLSRPQKLQPEEQPVPPPATPPAAPPLVAPPPVAAPSADGTIGAPEITPLSAQRSDVGLSASRDSAPDNAAELGAAAVAPPERTGHDGGHGNDLPSDYEGNALRRRRPYAKMLAWVIILTGLGVAAWWLYTFGTGLLQERIDGSVPNPQEVTELGPFRPDGAATQGEGAWLSVFDPARDVGNVDTGAGGAAKLVQRDGRQVMLITSADNTASGRILIRIPRGVVADIAGKAVTFEIVARGTDGAGQQIGIFCEFDALGTCGRKRFEADAGQVSHVFDVLTEDATLPAGRDAYLAFSTDLTDGKRGLYIGGIRVRAGS